ncbi:AA-permease domain-containing protein [Fusarium keratoplasticum]|uniref:AA-permease domain-containing protein n=1 Tax=Fusarium keratoplasticum TaxID=1328300 RepID=A0ACC0QHS0_9HYPO|nr:AA-permease domain-containing protein [Fusarium keratoplasticum]KAI8652733.1 AA-permease domain-containing protein [Fusarium keratoplasticum]KAI8653447.1 AA-permease domain-containing protein [Fusarium keratoplasticum]
MAETIDKEKLEELGAVESHTQGETVQSNELKRDFKPHQVFMFSIACAIGTGLVIGSGSGLSRGGPGSLLIAYMVIGLTVFFVMTALGEMATFLPMNKGFGGYATRMVDPAFGFATGWNYFLKYIIATPTNLTATGLILQYWRPDLNVAIWITVFGVLIITVNVLHVNSFGETEFWLGLCKVLIMTTLILSTLVVALGGGPNHDRSGFRYWQEPGAFAEYLAEGAKGRFLGWWACMVQACFAYTGTEVVGMTFGETPNPRKNVPRAVKQTFWRIAVFYILGILVLGMAVPYNSEKLIGATKQATSGAASPFVVSVSMAGVGVFPDFINACLLVFTLSAASSDIYCSSRSLYGLAKDGQAPRLFAKARENGNPIYAVAAASACIALGYMNASKSSSTVFGYFVSLVTVFAVLNWVAILITHIRFRQALKAQGIATSDLPYEGFMQPYGSYFALFISILVIIFNGYDAFIPHFKVDVFILKYIGTIIFLGNVTWWKLVKKTTFWDAEAVDLATGRREFEERESHEDAEWNGGLRKKVLGFFRK